MINFLSSNEREQANRVEGDESGTGVSPDSTDTKYSQSSDMVRQTLAIDWAFRRSLLSTPLSLDCRSMRRKRRRKRMMRERWKRRRRRGLGHPRFRRRYSHLPLSRPAFLTGGSHDCVSQVCCRGQQSTRHPWNRRQGQRGRGSLRKEVMVRPSARTA